MWERILKYAAMGLCIALVIVAGLSNVLSAISRRLSKALEKIKEKYPES